MTGTEHVVRASNPRPRLEDGWDDPAWASAAPIEIASIIARRLGLTGALGTVAEHVDGVYTGRLVGDMLHGGFRLVVREAVRALDIDGMHVKPLCLVVD